MRRNAFTCSVLGQIGADAAVNHAMALQHICRHRCMHDIALRGIFDDFNMQNIGQAHEAPLSGNKRIAMPSYYRSSKQGAPHNSSFPTRYALRRPRPHSLALRIEQINEENRHRRSRVHWRYDRATIQPSFKAQTATPRGIVAIPERSLFLFEILIGLLGAHSIATIHGERNEHTCHNGKIECKETPNER